MVQLIGNWQIGQKRPAADEVMHQVETSAELKRIIFDTEKLTGWDSSLLTFLTKVFKGCGQRNVQVETAGLPQGVQSLISLSTAVPRKEDARKTVPREAFFARVGSEFLEFIQSFGFRKNRRTYILRNCTFISKTFSFLSPFFLHF